MESIITKENRENKVINSCATKLPWHEEPFRLINWLEMNKFSADAFYRIGIEMGKLSQALYLANTTDLQFSSITTDVLIGRLCEIEKQCRKISLVQSAKCAVRTVEDIRRRRYHTTDAERAFTAIQDLIHSEMEEHLFLWVPGHRAEWYSKKANDIIGGECSRRFPSIRPEIEEGARCYAVGRYTASAFHLTRSMEAGVKALAKAINYSPLNDNWTLVFRQMGNEFKLPENQRGIHWQTHGKFLEEIWADLRAVSKAWRNDIAHLVDTYTEEEAKGLLDVIPLFLRHLATKMDENGKLY